jgi:DNA-binding LytR/AlgR family response regulator
MRFLIVILAFLLTAAAPPMVVGPHQRCDAGVCDVTDLAQVRLSGQEVTLVRKVTLPADAAPADRPVRVRVIAMASSELYWNDVLVGRNGVPGTDRASETPGRFAVSFVVPSHLVKPGENTARLRMSAHHLWLPVQRPVHAFAVGFLGSGANSELVSYLPALLFLGAFLAACAYFSLSAATERKDRSSLLLALIAGTAILQLGVEVSRAFLDYSYPWHLLRIAAIAVLAAIIATTAASYAASRFAPRWQRRIVFATVITASASVILIPGYDLKAIMAIMIGAISVGIAGIIGLQARRRGAAVALSVALVPPALIIWQQTAFLDQGWFVLVAVTLIVLVAEQVHTLRRVRTERDAQQRRATELSARLARAEREGEAILPLKEGSRIHRVAETDIVWIKAADDYCDVMLIDGREILVTMTLARLLETLPSRFVRVHRSFAVNCSHVAGVQPKPGGGRSLILSNGSLVPVGRSYTATACKMLDA